MKVLLISNMYPSESNPTYGVFVKTFENQLVKEGFEIKKAVISGRARSRLNKFYKYLLFFRDVFSSVKNGEYDLIYVHYINHSLLPLIFVKRKPKTALVVNAHGSDVVTTTRLSLLVQKIVAPIIKEADLLVVPSEYFKNIVYEKFSVSKDRLFVSPSGGINLSFFRPLNIRKINGIHTIGYVSRIDKGKGWDTLLFAVKQLLQCNITDFKVLMIGCGEQLGEFKAMIKDLDLIDHIDYLGEIPHDSLPQYYNRMDVFAFTTRRYESLGLVGLEAMACGVPVVGSEIGGLKSYIKPGINGEFFEPGNATDLANKLARMIETEKPELSIMGLNAIETAGEYDSNLIRSELINRLRSFQPKID
jgi:glycosyltransferase involved in cell wall biosynthesis